jgi:uncharacterized SAM-binding protein YcdF (DUF218 family)
METAILIASKLLGFCLMVETWLCLLMAAALIALLRGRRRLGIAFLASALAALIGLAVFPIGSVLLRPLEAEIASAPLPDAIDGIIVLGGAEDPEATALWGGSQFNEAAERFTEGVALWRRYPAAVLLFSGGRGRLRDTLGEGGPNPPVALTLFAALGVPEDRMLWEERSRTTTENARFSYDLVSPDPSQTWVLVTSAFHMGRALRSFEAAGWTGLLPHPVDYRSTPFRAGLGWNLDGNLDLLNIAIKERVGRFAYRMANR